MLSNASRLKPILPTVSIGSESVVIRRPGQSQPVVANILGTFKDGNGQVSRVVLDRLVHRLAESEYEGWRCSGAVVTELHRAQEADVVHVLVTGLRAAIAGIPRGQHAGAGVERKITRENGAGRAGQNRPGLGLRLRVAADPFRPPRPVRHD